MADRAFKERLQPALLDRLTDDERSFLSIRVSTTRERLAEAGLTPQSLREALIGHGLVLSKEDPTQESRTQSAAAEHDPARSGEATRSPSQQRAPDSIELRCEAPAGWTGAARLRHLPVRGPGAQRAVALESIADLESESVRNVQRESLDRRMLSMRRLRESVHRDLSWLLNSMSLDMTEDLSAWPEVQRSVLNYGLPSFAGQALAALDSAAAARRIERAIEVFEPRLSGVRVTPEVAAEDAARGRLTFLIEAELWGQPASQHLQLQTNIDVGTGDVTLVDAGR